MAKTNLPLTSLLTLFDGYDYCELTEHNRQQLDVSVDRIEDRKRMGNGRMRAYHVADKRTWSVSWQFIPAEDDKTVDGKAGGKHMENFYNINKGSFTLRLQHQESFYDETVNVFFGSFSKNYVNRGVSDFWDISLSLEEE